MDLNPGDAVKTACAFFIVKHTSENDEEFFVGFPKTKSKRSRLKRSQMILEKDIAGIYLGPQRKKVRDGRAGHGYIRMLYHAFFFNGVKIMLDPSNLEIVNNITEGLIKE